MRLALISDIHGNLEALQAVLKDIEGKKVDSVHCLGDVVGYGCDPVACLDLATANCKTILMGNHEYVALGLLSDERLNKVARESMEWTRHQLADRELATIAGFAMDALAEDAYLVHASPWEPDQWHYILAEDGAVTAFEHLRHQVCFFGHTHMPAIFAAPPGGQIRQQAGHSFQPDPEVRYLVNVGSVGQPRDNDPKACYAIYDTAEGEITYRRIEYDIATVQGKMKAAEAPSMLIERIAVGR